MQQLIVAAILMLAGLGVAGAAPAQVAPTNLPPVCQKAFDSEWKTAIKAMEDGRFETALAASAPVMTACADQPHALAMLGVFRANLDLELRRPADAVVAMDAAPAPRDHPVWVRSRLLYLLAFQALGDEARFRAVRDELVAINAENLTSGEGAYMRLTEQFETDVAFIQAFERQVSNGEPRHTLFVATPKGPGMPESFEVNEGGRDGLTRVFGGVKKRQSDLVLGDQNGCGMHDTLIIPAEEAATYAGLRARAVDLFTGPNAFATGPNRFTGDPADALAGPAIPDVCPGLFWVLPGLPRAQAPDED